MIRFNKKEMRTYFEGFDYIDYKYGPLLKGANAESDSTTTEIVLMFKKDFVRYERAKNHNLYEKIDYNQIYDRLKLIYNDSEEAESIIFLYDFSLGQLIDRFINIPSLDKLFSHHYFEYEWEQHVDMNFEKNQLSFYRDHFVHQMRNCYMIMRYLDFSENGENSYYNKIMDTLKFRANSVSQYACSQVEQYADYIRDKIWSDNMRYGESPFSESVEGGLNGVVNQMTRNVDDFAWSYLIRGSLIVAALFHDIGYPIRYTYKGAEAVSDYISLVRPSDNVGFDRLNDLLENSLLFKTVSKEELRERYLMLDHGALSAYILLMQFYESGAIRELDPIKKAIIELAAVITYDHTLKYRFLGDSADGINCIREKPSFIENPLSYTLRFIDDIQEWDRLYFEIEGKSEYLFCNRCRMPIVATWDSPAMTKELRLCQSFCGDMEHLGENDARNKKKEMEENFPNTSFENNFSLEYLTSPMKKTIYVCGCTDVLDNGDKPGEAPYCVPYDFGLNEIRKTVNGKTGYHRFSTGGIERGSLFQYQSINYTITCDDVLLIRNEGKDVFYIDYNPYKELYLLLLNHKALRYRVKEIAKLSSQFNLQSGINMTARAYITENPIMLKARILCDFLYEIGAYAAADSDLGHNHYKRNLVYYDMLHQKKASSCDGVYETLCDFVSWFKEKNFFAYGYRDDGVRSGENDKGEANGTAHEETMNGIQGILGSTVLFLMGHADEDATGPASAFVNNLANTLNCYIRLLFDYFAASLDDSVAPDKTRGNKISGWLRKEIKFSALEDEYFNLEYANEPVYRRACEIVFRDFISQLYYQSDKGKGIEKYYGMREKKPGEGKEKGWDDKEYVVGADEMEYALEVLFDEKYYNPMIMKDRCDVNKKAGAFSFTFFDIHSDMYLFKEMSDFTEDNRSRRLVKAYVNISDIAKEFDSARKEFAGNEENKSATVKHVMAAVSESLGLAYDEVARRLADIGYSM